MADQLTWVEEPLPFRGKNDALSPVNLEPGYAQDAHDVVLDEAGAIRPRYGWKRTMDFKSLYTNYSREIPVGFMRMPASNQVLYTHLSYPSNSAFGQYYSGGYDIDNTILKAYGYAATAPLGGSTFALTDGSETRKLLPFGRPIRFLEQDIATSVGQPSRFYKTSSVLTPSMRTLSLYAGGTGAVQTRDVTINNGSRTGTLSSALTGSVNGLYMVVGATGGETAGYKYVYRVDPATSGVNLSLLDNYGLGEAGALIPNIAAQSATFYPVGYIPNAPDAYCVASWRERVFAVASTIQVPPAPVSGGEVRNVLMWSQVSDYNRWPAANYIQMDAVGRVSACAATNDALFLFEENRTWVVTGSDESNFQLRLLFDDIGCIHQNAVCTYQDQVFVCGLRGIYRIGPDGGVQNLVKPDASSGIEGTYRALVVADGTDRGVGSFPINVGLPWLHVTDEKLWLSMDRLLGTTAEAAGMPSRPLSLMCDLQTGAWTTWGKLTGRYDNPSLIHNSGQYLIGMSRDGGYDMSSCWDNEITHDALGASPYLDELYTSGGTTTSSVDARFTTRDMMFADGKTTRVQTIAIEHGCTCASGTVNPWTVTLDMDQDIDTTSMAVGSVKSRVVTWSRSKYYHDHFTNAVFPTEGMVFRMAYTFAGANVTGAKLYRSRLQVLRTPTKSGRVDNSGP